LIVHRFADIFEFFWSCYFICTIDWICSWQSWNSYCLLISLFNRL